MLMLYITKMKLALFIAFLIVFCIVIYLYFNYQYADMTYIQSDIDNKYYLVRNKNDRSEAANTLAKIRQNVIKLADYMYENKDKYKEYLENIELLYNKKDDIIYVESTQDSEYTSYCVNKGEQIVFCLRTKHTGNEMHDLNLIMYVVLHEISHVGDPQYSNHGDSFKRVFAFFTKCAIDIELYEKKDYNAYPEDYCGMMINESIV